MTPHRQSKLPVLQIGIPAEKHLLGKNPGNVSRHIGIVITASAAIRQPLQKSLVRAFPHGHCGQRHPCRLIRRNKPVIVPALPLAIRQKYHMTDTHITFRHPIQSLPQRRLNGGSAPFRDGPDLVFDLLSLGNQGRFHHPAEGIVKGQNPHIIGAPHLVHRRLGRSNGQVQIGETVSRCRTHAAGMINYHDHRRRRRLIHAPQFHVHRQKGLQHALPITAQRKTLLSAAADQTAAIILHISLHIVQKSFRQIPQIYIDQNNASVFQQLFQRSRRIAR